MFNFKKITEYYTRVFIAAFVVAAALFVASLIAVSIAAINPNQPIIPSCPTGNNGNNIASALDTDGIIVDVSITNVSSDETLYSTIQTAIGGASSDGGGKNHIILSDVIPATKEGGVLTARLYVYDTIPEGTHKITITFANSDAPIAQTATCIATVLVAKGRSDDGSITTSATIQNSDVPGGSTNTDTYVRQFTTKVAGGMLPGVTTILMATLLCANFISALFGLESVGKGVQFLKHRIFGRPGFAPFLIIEGGKIGIGDEGVKKMGGPAGLVLRQDSAIIIEEWGTLNRIIRGPAFPALEPFEKIWDIIDLRPQRWPFKVSAITRDGIPITYEVAVKFRVGDTDDDIFKAATCKWIRDAWRTEPDRLMDWVKRVMLSATEGTMRNKILARYKLDELLDVSIRRKIREDLIEALTASAANNFGVKIMEVTLHDVEFQGQVLQEWCKTWKARRDIEVQKIESNERVQELKMRKHAENQVCQEMLDSTIKTLNTLAKDSTFVSLDYVLLSFIEMVEHTAFAQKVFIPEDSLSKLNKIKQNLR